MDTIFALASGRGRSGVAVVRLSGPGSHDVVRRLTGSVPEVRKASLRTLRWRGEVLDEALVLVFAAGESFTGEEAAELQVHGGQAVIAAVLSALGACDDVRIAEPGEFTRRALENGRMELFEVEGLADLIDAETEAQRKQAQRLLTGDFARKVAGWRDNLLTAAALIEATVDFADEDVPVDVWPEVTARLKSVLGELRADLAGSHAAERIRNGFEVVLYGPPNVGKSSIINALSGRDAAMTSEIAGTTRDVIEVRMDIAGLPVTILDTAGLRDTADPLEMEGVRRARLRAAQADLRVLVTDEATQGWCDDGIAADIVVASKADLGWRPAGRVSVSAHTGEGIAQVLSLVEDRLEAVASTAGVVIHERHRESVSRAVEALQDGLDGIANSAGAELIALSVRGGRLALERLVGKIGVEDLLGAIFSRFCIGK